MTIKIWFAFKKFAIKYIILSSSRISHFRLFLIAKISEKLPLKALLLSKFTFSLLSGLRTGLLFCCTIWISIPLILFFWAVMSSIFIILFSRSWKLKGTLFNYSNIFYSSNCSFNDAFSFFFNWLSLSESFFYLFFIFRIGTDNLAVYLSLFCPFLTEISKGASLSDESSLISNGCYDIIISTIIKSVHN